MDAHIRALSESQLENEKYYKGYLSWNVSVESFEKNLLINDITDTGVQKLT